MNTHEDYEKLAFMIDSGASETVASVEKFESYPYSLAAGKQAEAFFVNVSQRYIGAVGDHGTVRWAKFQMCRGLGQDKILRTVSRLVESRHSVVFRHPDQESCTQNISNGCTTYFARVCRCGC